MKERPNHDAGMAKSWVGLKIRSNQAQQCELWTAKPLFIGVHKLNSEGELQPQFGNLKGGVASMF